MHAVTLAGDGTLSLVVLPLGSEVGGAGEHLPVQVGTRGVVALRLAACILAGTIPERDLVGFASCPCLVGSIDEELGIPRVGRVVDRSDLDAVLAVGTTGDGSTEHVALAGFADDEVLHRAAFIHLAVGEVIDPFDGEAGTAKRLHTYHEVHPRILPPGVAWHVAILLPTYVLELDLFVEAAIGNQVLVRTLLGDYEVVEEEVAVKFAERELQVLVVGFGGERQRKRGHVTLGSQTAEARVEHGTLGIAWPEGNRLEAVGSLGIDGHIVGLACLKGLGQSVVELVVPDVLAGSGGGHLEALVAFAFGSRKLDVGNKRIEPLHGLLRMPCQGVAIDSQASVFGSIDKRRNGREVHIALVIDTRGHLHGIAGDDLVEIGGGEGIEHSLVVEL